MLIYFANLQYISTYYSYSSVFYLVYLGAQYRRIIPDKPASLAWQHSSLTM